MCQTRWNTSNEHFNETLENNPFLHEACMKKFNNEMATASNIASHSHNAHVVLANQPIETTIDRIKCHVKKTCNDTHNQHNGGWENLLHDEKNMQNNAMHFWCVARTKNDKEKNHFMLCNDFLDARSLEIIPFSLFRHPLSALMTSNGFTMLSMFLSILSWKNVYLSHFLDSFSSSVLSTTIDMVKHRNNNEFHRQ